MWMIIAFLFMFFDIFYFLRLFLTVIIAKLRKPIKFLAPSSLYGLCFVTDVDFLLIHMNNARYLREFDFSRFDYLTRAGFLDNMAKIGGNIPVVASTIRYRLPLYLFSPYKIITVPIWWDEKSFYFEHKVVTLLDGKVRSVSYLKLAGVKINFEKVIRDIHGEVEKPDCPEDLQKWIQTNDLSSLRLKEQAQSQTQNKKSK